jgi:hypothetical protein
VIALEDEGLQGTEGQRDENQGAESQAAESQAAESQAAEPMVDRKADGAEELNNSDT